MGCVHYMYIQLVQVKVVMYLENKYIIDDIILNGPVKHIPCRRTQKGAWPTRLVCNPKISNQDSR